MFDKNDKIKQKNIYINDIATEGVGFEMSPTDNQLNLLNEMLPLDMTFTSLAFKINLCWQVGREVLMVSGTVDGIVHTRCVVSNKPMQIKISDPFEVGYNVIDKKHNKKTCFHKKNRVGENDYLKDETHLEMESIQNGRIDIIDVAMQSLFLSIPNHPSIDDLRTEQINVKSSNFKLPKNNPFHILKKIKGKT